MSLANLSAALALVALPLFAGHEAFALNNSPIGGHGVTGGACTVIGGPNTGKKGTFDSEGSCCDEERWGCTDCTDSSGKDNGKCKASARAPVNQIPNRSTTVAPSTQ
jgi:hypothetical protein